MINAVIVDVGRLVAGKGKAEGALSGCDLRVDGGLVGAGKHLMGVL